jgi:F-type H+-transporting ATPase subunit delta
MIPGSIARRYAKALFSLAVEKGRIEPWTDHLVALGQAIDTSSELSDVLQNPAYTRETRAAVVGSLATAMKLDAEPAALLQLLGERNRLSGLSAIVTAFRELADVELGRLRARVTSAVPLDDAAITAIAGKLSAATQKQVLVERAIDPDILGGVVAQVGSVVYDGSLRTQLEDLRTTLKR